MIQKLKIFFVLVLISFVSLKVKADDEISTDRPDFVESSNVVGKMNLQVETSLNWETDSKDGVKTKTRSTPTLFRFGLAKNLEARIETDGFMKEKITSPDSETINNSGSSDIALGFKWHMADGKEKTFLPSQGWLLHADFDSGSSEFRGKDIRPSLRYVAEWDMPCEMSFGVMPGFVYDKDENNKRFVNGILAGVLGHNWTEKFRTFIEVSGQQIASIKHGGNILTFDVGGAYLISKRTQIDSAASWALNSETPDFSWTIGFSFKVGKE